MIVLTSVEINLLVKEVLKILLIITSKSIKLHKMNILTHLTNKWNIEEIIKHFKKRKEREQINFKLFVFELKHVKIHIGKLFGKQSDHWLYKMIQLLIQILKDYLSFIGKKCNEIKLSKCKTDMFWIDKIRR